MAMSNFIFFFILLCLRNRAESSSASGKYFKKIRDYGGSFELDEVMSNHIVDSQKECSMKCLEEQFCIGYNYKAKSNKGEINCQISANATLEKQDILHGPWVFYQDPETFPTFAIPPTKEEKEWTLIARFSNGDSKHWIVDGVFWYDRNTPYGDVNNPLPNADMISSSFWELKGREIKITRSDDSSHTALLQTTSNCLQGATFRSKMTSYGNFRNRAAWASDRCLGSCPVIYSGQYKTTAGFEQHSCSSNMQSSGYIGFWCDWSSGDGAVMMIGGGGNNCARADHGIGITEINEAQFGVLDRHYDFGHDADVVPPSTYSLNLWVR